MTEIAEIIEKLINFRDQRDWKQFHDSKNLALAISIEAAELNEIFLWKKENESFDIEKLKEELADIFAFSFLLAAKHNLDVRQMIFEKIEINEQKYPVDLSKGKSTKYKDL